MKAGARSVLGPQKDRLDSWKEIAMYQRREVRTVRRWKKRERLPVQRHVHAKASSVCAFKHEIDAWLRSRSRASSEPAPNKESSEAKAESLNPAVLVAARLPSKSQLWLQNAAEVAVPGVQQVFEVRPEAFPQLGRSEERL